VTDDGKGFGVVTDDGIGLAGMRERAGMLGGTLRIDSAPGRGTTIDLSVPIPEDQP
jgi:signal transduction histidine kinase